MPPALDALIKPRSVAVIGASTNPDKVGGVPVALLTRLGYAGRIVPVHPSAREIQGLPALPDIRAAGAIDLAIVSVPEREAAAVLRACADAGVKAAIMFTSGFAEMGVAGAAAQQEIAAICARGGITLLGPNCLGVMNLAARMFATFTPAPLTGALPVGRVGLVSQSGAFGSYAFTLARRSGLGLSHWVTTGNEAGVQVADVIEWFARDPDTDVILAYLEGCRDGARLRRALEAARAAGKPVVVTKVGRTAAGARAALSHTASLAGEDAVYDAVFEECAAIRAHSIEEFFRLGQAFATAPRPANDAVAIMTISGGVGTLMADRAEDLGVALPPLGDAEAAQLRAEVPFCATGNPIDFTGQVIGRPEAMVTACAAAARAGRYGGFALFTASGAVTAHFWHAMLRAVRALGAESGVAVAVSGVVSAEQKRELLEGGCLVYEEPTHAIEVLAALRRYEAARNTTRAAPAAAVEMRLPTAGALNEAEALAFLDSGGVRAAPHAVARNADEAAALAERFAAPVAVKLLSRDVLHKSDVGGVLLGVQGADAARAAFETIQDNARRMAPGAAFEGVLVARMVAPVLECMAGARLDPVFGPVVAFGVGGTEVEWIKRVALVTAPADPARVRQLLERLDIPRRLDGWRGGPKVGIDGLVAAVCGVARLAAAAGPRLVNLEVNPLMVTAEGVFAADAVVELS